LADCAVCIIAEVWGGHLPIGRRRLSSVYRCSAPRHVADHFGGSLEPIRFPCSAESRRASSVFLMVHCSCLSSLLAEGVKMPRLQPACTRSLFWGVSACNSTSLRKSEFDRVNPLVAPAAIALTMCRYCARRVYRLCARTPSCAEVTSVSSNGMSPVVAPGLRVALDCASLGPVAILAQGPDCVQCVGAHRATLFAGLPRRSAVGTERTSPSARQCDRSRNDCGPPDRC
jgi:hypothetical protein